MPPQVTAFVPLKEHSERVPWKNLRELCRRPLFTWILDTLKASSSIERVVVDVDSDRLESVVLRYAPFVEILRRPTQLLGDHINANQLIEWWLTQIPGEHFLQTHATNPLVRSGTIDVAVDTYFAALPAGHDSLFAVNEHRIRLYNSNTEPVNHNPHALRQTQDIAPIYSDNSCLYVFSRDSFAATSSRIGKRPKMFAMPLDESVDIDTESDFRVAAQLMSLA